MKKFIFILILLSMGKVAVAYAAETTPASRAFIFGNTAQSADTLNQVLVLLTGKDGKPGAAGVAGARGLNGLDGIQGIPGVAGAPGVAGRDGAQGIQGLQGLQGLQGPGGPAGPAGPAGEDGEDGSGTGGGGSLDFGNGQVTVGSCSDSATVGLQAAYDGNDFFFDTITIADLKSECGTQVMKFYFKVKSAPWVNHQVGLYNNGDVLKCTFSPIPTSGLIRIPQFGISKTTTCINVTQPAIPTFYLGEISTADYTGKIGFEITRT
jgi:hypothetical protein